MSKGSQRKVPRKWADEQPNLDAVREQRGIYFIPDDDPDSEEFVDNARRKVEIGRASAMLCKVATPADANGSSWRDPVQGNGLRWKQKKLNSSCLKKDREDIINHRFANDSNTKEDKNNS